LLQLSSELSAPVAVAAFGLNTEVKIQTLRARISRAEQLAANLTARPTKSRGATGYQRRS
jgi:hypothetical protein